MFSLAKRRVAIRPLSCARVGIHPSLEELKPVRNLSESGSLGATPLSAVALIGQVRYRTYEAAWMLMAYKGRNLMAPLAEVHPGLVVVVAAEGARGSKGGVSDSPFPMPKEVLQ